MYGRKCGIICVTRSLAAFWAQTSSWRIVINQEVRNTVRRIGQIHDNLYRPCPCLRRREGIALTTFATKIGRVKVEKNWAE